MRNVWLFFPAERSHSGSCDSKPSENNSTLRKELKQFFGWMRKHSYGCTDVSIKLYDQWRVWLQKAQKTHDQVSKNRHTLRLQTLIVGTHDMHTACILWFYATHKKESPNICLFFWSIRSHLIACANGGASYNLQTVTTTDGKTASQSNQQECL